MKLKTLLVVVLAIELNARGSSGRITEAPLNAVAEVGQQVIFNCTSDTTLQNWIFSAKREDLGTPSGQNIVLNCVVQSAFAANYEVDRPGGSNNKCNMIVKGTTKQQAGVYTCSDSAPGQSAILTVIDRDPSITVKNTSGVVAGDIVTMSYTVRYNTSTASSQTLTIQPVLTWTDSDGNAVTGSPSSTANSVSSSISITAERQSIQPYTCSISYQVYGSTTMFASNTPNSFSTPPRTPSIDVSYAPEIQSITNGANVPICPSNTVTITCNASANPQATYSWIYTRNYSGTTITAADMNGVYACTASNVIRGSIHSDTNEITLNVSGNSCETAKTNDSQGYSLSTVATVLGSLLALSLAVNIATIIVLMRNRSKPKTGLKANETFNMGQRNDEVHNQNEAEEPNFPAVYQELGQTRQQPTIYAQLAKR